MELRVALEPVIGELVMDKMHTYLSRLVVEDLLLRSEVASSWHRYLALETVVELIHRTDSRYPELKKEYQQLKVKYAAKVRRQRKQVIKQ